MTTFLCYGAEEKKGDENAILSVKYHSYLKEGVVYYIFRMKNLTDEDLMIAHIESSPCYWQYGGRGFSHRLPNSSAKGYTFLGVAEKTFLLRSDRHHVVGSKSLNGEYVNLLGCTVNAFKKEGYKAFKYMKVKLGMEKKAEEKKVEKNNAEEGE